MALKAVLESLDGVDDALHDLYIQKEVTDPQTKKSATVYVLDISEVQTHPDVLGLKASRDKLLNEKKTAERQLAEVQKKLKALPEDFNPDDLEGLIEAKQELEELKSRIDDDPDNKRLNKMYEDKIARINKAYDDKLAKLTKSMSDGFAERDAIINQKHDKIVQIVARDGLAAELAKNGVKKEAIPFVQAKLERSVKVVEGDDGELSAVFNADLGEKPLDEYIRDWVQTDEAKLFVEPAKGGGASGGAGAGHNANNPWMGKPLWNLTQQGQMMRSDPMKAERLAKAAGHKSAARAVLADAKAV